MRIYLEDGGDASKCVMSHLNRKNVSNFLKIIVKIFKLPGTIIDDEKLLEFSGGYWRILSI